MATPGKTAAQRALEERRKNRTLPTVESYKGDDRALADALDGVLEHLRMYEGDSGAPRQRFVTIQELESAGLIKSDVKQGFAYISQVLTKDVAQKAGSTSNPSQKDPVKKGTALEGRVPGTNTTKQNQGPISYATGGGGSQGKLGSLSDVNVPGSAQSDFLAFNGTRWINFGLFSNQNLWTKQQTWARPLRLVHSFSPTAKPAAPTEGHIILWARDDNTLWFTDDQGTETQLGTGGGLQASDNAVITGQWTFEARVDIDDGSALRIHDSTDTDYAEFSHDGTDFNTDFATTGEWNINDVGVLFTGGGSALSSGDGFWVHHDNSVTPSKSYIDARDPGNTGEFDYADLQMRCADLSWLVVGTADVLSLGAWVGGGAGTTLGDTGVTLIKAGGEVQLDSTTTGIVIVKDANTLRIEDDAESDWADFSHDGTDFNTDFTNTTDWNINDVDVRITNNVFAANLPQPKYKTADESVTSSVTLQDDDHLAGYTLEADQWYAIDGYLEITSATAPDFKAALQFTNAPQDGSWSMIGRRPTAATGAAVGNSVATATGTLAVTFGGADTIGFRVQGFIRTNATTGGTMDFQWAQNASSGTSATINAGSWLSITKMV